MTPFEYGFATQFGLYFGTIEKQIKNEKEKYVYKEKPDEIYMKDTVVRSFVECGLYKIAACGLLDQKITLIDREQKGIIMEIINPMSHGMDKQR